MHPAFSAEPVLFAGSEVNGQRLLAKLKASPKSSGDQSARSSSTGSLARVADASPAVAALRPLSEVPGVVILEMDPWPQMARRSARDEFVDRTAEIKARIEALMATGLYEYVEPDRMRRLSTVPNDAALSDGRLWGLLNNGQNGGVAGADIEPEEAWQQTAGANVVVAVLDTGVRYTHQDLRDNMWTNPGEIPGNGIDDDRNGYVDDVYGIDAVNNDDDTDTDKPDPNDDNGHGTHVAGTIAAVANGGGPHVGVAWGARIMALDCFTRYFNTSRLRYEWGAFDADMITCIDYAIAKGANVINASLGGSGFNAAVRDALVRASQARILFIAAAGNGGPDQIGDNNDITPQYPAGYEVENVISVAALDRSDQLARFSNFGSATVDLGAPGVDIFSSTADSDSTYASYSGTSMAAPHVAGVAALLVSRFPGDTVAQWRARLLGNVRPVAALASRVVSGGATSAARALGADSGASITASLSTRPDPLQAQRAGALLVRLTSQGNLLSGATVSGAVAGRSLVFLDNGAAPDESAGDGVYSATLDALDAGDYSLVINATHPTAGSLSDQSLPFVVGASSVDNDNFEDGRIVQSGEQRLTANSTLATAQTGEPSWREGTPARKTLWWRWSPATSGSATISTYDSGFDTTLAVFTGDTLTGLTRVAANDDGGFDVQSEVTFTAEGGRIYHIQVDGYGGDSGEVVLNVPPSADVAGPPVFTRNPSDVAVRQGSVAVFSAEATGNPAPSYSWRKNGEPLADGDRISGSGTSVLTITDVQRADEGSYVCVASNVNGERESSAASLLIDAPGILPANDNFKDRIVLTDGIAVEGSNSLAGREPDEPDHAGAGGGASVWYRWVAPFDGPVSVSTSGSSFDTALAVYRGTALDNLVAVGANNDNGDSRQSLVQFTAKEGVEYSLAVDGGTPGANGFVRLLLQASTSDGGEVIVPAPNLPQPLPDLATVTSEIIVSGRPVSVPVSSILFDLNLTHSYRGDLLVTLQAPSGQTITISNRQGGGASDIIISSEPVNSPLFTGTWPANINPNGTWRLIVQDLVAGDSGTLNAWALRFTGGTPPPAEDDETVFPWPEAPRPVPDLESVVSTIVVSGQPAELPPGAIRLDLLVRHSWRGDLVVTLTTPEGRVLTISDREGGPSDDIVIAAQPLDSPAFTAALPGVLDPNGVWTLRIEDTVGGDAGTLESWSLRVGTAAVIPPPSPPVAGAPAPGTFFGIFGDLDFGDRSLAAREQFDRLNGFLSVKVTKKGKLSGRLLYRGQQYRLRGVFDSNGTWSTAVGLSDDTPLLITLQAGQTAAGRACLDGAIEVSGLAGGTRTLPCRLTLPSLAGPWATQRPRVNILLRTFNPAAPPVIGDGFATARMGRAGTFRLQGQTPDGRKFSGTGYLADTDQGGAQALIALPLADGTSLIGEGVVEASPAFGQPHFAGVVGWVSSSDLVSFLAQGVVWNAPRGHLLGGQVFVQMGFRPPWKGYFNAPVVWPESNKPVLSFGDAVVPIRVARSSGLFTGYLPGSPAADNPRGSKFQGLLLGSTPIEDEGVLLYGGGYLLEPGASSFVELFVP